MFSGHSFSPAEIAILGSVFEAVWAEIEPKTHAGNQAQVREVIAVALIDLAKAGQLDPVKLNAYAMGRGWRVLLSPA